MISGWIIGLVISLLCFIMAPDESTKGWMLVAVAYFTIGLAIDCHKAQNRLPQESYQKKLALLTQQQAKDNLEIRKQLLKQIDYLCQINKMYNRVIQEQASLKVSVFQLTELLETLVNCEETTTEDNSDNIDATIDPSKAPEDKNDEVEK